MIPELIYKSLFSFCLTRLQIKPLFFLLRIFLYKEKKYAFIYYDATPYNLCKLCTVHRAADLCFKKLYFHCASFGKWPLCHVIKRKYSRILGTIMKFKHQSNFESSSVTASQLYSTVDPHHVSQELFWSFRNLRNAKAKVKLIQYY